MVEEIYFSNLNSKKNFKILENCRKALNINCRGEDYVLQWILNEDISRNIILQRIDKIKLERGLIRVECSTRHGSYGFSVSDLDSAGWLPDMTEDMKRSNISTDLRHKIRR